MLSRERAGVVDQVRWHHARDGYAEADFRSDAASPRKTAANTTKTTPMPEESRVKSTIATIRNTIPAAALPNACLDM